MSQGMRLMTAVSCAALLAACAELRSSQRSAQPGERPVFTQSGLASWYGSAHHGKRTASGEIFNMEQLTAAHRTLPFGTVVRVTSSTTKRTVKVRIIDRGPFVANRIIDLSARAARDLGIEKLGVTRVRIEQYTADQTGG